MENEKVKKVFLSGGTQGSWQDQVKQSVQGAEFFDPRTLRNLPMEQIARTERAWLDLCDCLFFYFEVDNPSGLGSAFEVGYCVANRIPVIFVDLQRTSHSEWLGIHCNHVFHAMDDGITALKEFVLNSSREGGDEG
jgi:nucleoside 2-deoxyribosyltransferase